MRLAHRLAAERSHCARRLAMWSEAQKVRSVENARRDSRARRVGGGGAILSQPGAGSQSCTNDTSLFLSRFARALLVGFLGSAYGFGTHPAVPVQQRSARARCLPQLNVQNLRPVSPSLPGIYRSAAFEQATDADAALILDGMRIRTVIDLRSQDEIDKALAAATPVGRALFAAYADGAPVGPGQLASEGTGRLRRVHVPLLADVDAFWEFVATKLSPAKRAEAMLYRSVDGKRYDRLLYDELPRQASPQLF